MYFSSAARDAVLTSSDAAKLRKSHEAQLRRSAEEPRMRTVFSPWESMTIVRPRAGFVPRGAGGTAAGQCNTGGVADSGAGGCSGSLGLLGLASGAPASAVRRNSRQRHARARARGIGSPRGSGIQSSIKSSCWAAERPLRTGKGSEDQATPERRLRAHRCHSGWATRAGTHLALRTPFGFVRSHEAKITKNTLTRVAATMGCSFANSWNLRRAACGAWCTATTVNERGARRVPHDRRRA